MIEIAKLQNELLSIRYNAEERTPYPLSYKRKGLFGGNWEFPPSYQEKAELLKRKQDALTRERIANGYSDGCLWWNLPWERVAPILLHNLTFPREEAVPDDCGLRKAFTFSTTEGRYDNSLLCVRMDEHFQKIHSSRNVKDFEYSDYTPAEREAMVDAYNEKKNWRAVKHIYFNDVAGKNVGIHSVTTGMDYNSAMDYYTSAEYLSKRMWESENYSQSLYSVEERHTLEISSVSQNHMSIHALCEFHTDAIGTLDYMCEMDFAELYAAGSQSMPSADYFRTRDAAVIASLLLAENSAIRQIPLSLFEKGYDNDQYADVLRQAQIITCLAYKLKGD